MVTILVINVAEIKVGNRQTIDTLISKEALLLRSILSTRENNGIHEFHAFSSLFGRLIFYKLLNVSISEIIEAFQMVTRFNLSIIEN